MTMMRKEAAGDYQIGIWSVRKEGRVWIAQATGPGTIGDERHLFVTLGAAYLALTGEPRNAAAAQASAAVAKADNA